MQSKSYHVGRQTLTCYTVLGHQSRAQGAEGVKGFSQQPLLSVAFHLPVASTHVMCHREAGHVSHGICGLWGQGIWPGWSLYHSDAEPVTKL